MDTGSWIGRLWINVQWDAARVGNALQLWIALQEEIVRQDAFKAWIRHRVAYERAEHRQPSRISNVCPLRLPCTQIQLAYVDGEALKVAGQWPIASLLSVQAGDVHAPSVCSHVIDESDELRPGPRLLGQVSAIPL